MATTIANKHYMDPIATSEYIGRGSKYGNPFSHKDGTKAKHKVATREIAVAEYYKWILKQPELLMSLHELKNKQLVCYCAPHACHGDCLIRLLDNTFFLVIAGGREFADYDHMKKRADHLLRKVTKEIVIVSGRAPGADRLGEKYARERGYGVAEFPADWNGPLKKRAGIVRNEQMADFAKKMRGGSLIFWDGKSPGSKHMSGYCKKIGLQTFIESY